MWSAAIVAGIPDELFWELTVQEVEEVLKRRGEEARAATYRAAFLAASFYNANGGGKGGRLMKPSDFIKRRPVAEDYMSVEETVARMDKWAAAQTTAAVHERGK